MATPTSGEHADATSIPFQPDTLKFKIPVWRHIQLNRERVATNQKIFWSTDWYENDHGHSVKIHYADNIDDAEILAQHFETDSVLGFDMEWKVIFGRTLDGLKENVSLIQLAKDGEVGLFHIARHVGTTAPELFAPTLLKIIQSKSIIKTGVAIYTADARQLRTYAGIEAKGLFELSQLYQLLEHSTKGKDKPEKQPKNMVGLSKQVQMHLGFPLKKDGVRTSDWTAPLSKAQRKYAAADAYAGLVLYHTMNAKRQKLDPEPPQPESATRTRAKKSAADATGNGAFKKQDTLASKGSRNQTEDPNSSDNAFEMGDEPAAAPVKKPRFRVPPTWSQPYEEVSPSQETAVETPPLQSQIPPAFAEAPKRRVAPASAQSEPTTHPKRKHEPSPRIALQEINTNKRHAPTTAHKSEPTGLEKCHAALRSLRQRLMADAKTEPSPLITENTLMSIARSRPKSVPELCRIPGAVPFMQYCRANEVDLLAFVGKYS